MQYLHILNCRILYQNIWDGILVIGVSRQGFLNNVGKYLFGRKDAHAMARMRPEAEMDIFRKYCNVQKAVNVFFLADVYALTFKKD